MTRAVTDRSPRVGLVVLLSSPRRVIELMVLLGARIVYTRAMGAEEEEPNADDDANPRRPEVIRRTYHASEVRHK